MIDAKTLLFGLLGWPIDYTMSPQIHNQLSEKEGRNAVYLAFPTEEKNLETFVAFARVYLKGFNVTVPYKEKILPFLDSVDFSASVCGAVNTVRVADGKLIGYNTDGGGGKRCIEEKLSLSGKTAVIKGAGGAARGLAAALLPECRVLIDARRKEQAEALVACLASFYPEREISVYAGQRGDILINATTLGSESQPGMPFTEEQVRHSLLVYDAVYAPRKTELILTAEKFGIPTVLGMDMLTGQALLAREIFFAEERKEEDSER